MNKIEFITWRTLWETTPTVIATVTEAQGILQYKHNGRSVSDLFFNDADYSFYDIMLDYDAIKDYIYPLTDGNPYSPTIPYVPTAYDTHQKLWRLGVKLYHDTTLLFTGLVFIESIKINEDSFTFKFTASSVLLALKKIVPALPYYSTSSLFDLTSISDVVNTLWTDSKSMLGVGAYTAPGMIYPGGGINMPQTSISYLLPNYDNDFDDWEAGLSTVNSDDYLYWNYKSIRYYPQVSGTGSNLPTIFLMKAWRRYSNHIYFISLRVKVYVFSVFNPLQPVSVIDYEYNGSSSSPSYINEVLEGVIVNSSYWLSLEQRLSFGIVGGTNYTISITGSELNYVGDYVLNELSLKPETTSLNPFEAIENIARLKQCQLVNDENGNILFAYRPPVTDTSSTVTVNNDIIDNPVKSGVYLKQLDLTNMFTAFNGSQNLINFLEQYNLHIQKKYRTKLSITYDGLTPLDLGDKFRYKNSDYFVTMVKPNYDTYGTDIEAYGEK